MPKNLRINYIELPASDMSAIKSFYGSAFGWTFEDYGPTYCAFNDGSFDGGFYQSDKRSHTDDGSALVVLYSDDLEDTFQKIREHGGQIVKEIFSFPGGRRFHFADPHGNELAVWSDVMSD